MITHIKKWGNSQGMRFPREILRSLNISTGDEVEITTKDGSIIVKPNSSVRSKYKLEDLTDKMPKSYKTSEEDWGLPAGKEVW
jgi:antitoxin MazE